MLVISSSLMEFFVPMNAYPIPLISSHGDNNPFLPTTCPRSRVKRSPSLCKLNWMTRREPLDIVLDFLVPENKNKNKNGRQEDGQAMRRKINLEEAPRSLSMPSLLRRSRWAVKG